MFGLAWDCCWMDCIAERGHRSGLAWTALHVCSCPAVQPDLLTWPCSLTPKTDSGTKQLAGVHHQTRPEPLEQGRT